MLMFLTLFISVRLAYSMLILVALPSVELFAFSVTRNVYWYVLESRGRLETSAGEDWMHAEINTSTSTRVPGG